MSRHSALCTDSVAGAGCAAAGLAATSAPPVTTMQHATPNRITYRQLELCRLLPPRGRKAVIERVVLGRHVEEQLRRLEARAVLLLERLALFDEALGAHHVDIAERATRERGKAEAEDRADIAFAHVGEHAFLEDARGLERLHDEEALFQLLHESGIGVDLVGRQALALQLFEPVPQVLRTGLRVVVEALPVLAAE